MAVMAGFKRPRLVLDSFTGDLQGLEIVMRRPTIRQFFELSRMSMSPGEEVSDEDIAEFERVRDVLTDHMISWNMLDDDDTPASCTMSGADMTLVLVVLREFVSKVSDVAAPLAQPSKDGEPFPVDTIPMEIASPNLSS